MSFFIVIVFIYHLKRRIFKMQIKINSGKCMLVKNKQMNKNKIDAFN